MLHGWAQSPSLFRSKTSNLAKKLRLYNLDFAYAAAGNVVPPREGQGDNQGARSWFLFREDDPTHCPEDLGGGREAFGAGASVEAAAKAFVEEGCDGIIGFSQGAAFAHHLCELGEGGIKPWDSIKFVVMIGGYSFPGSGGGHIGVRSLHVWGARDVRVRPLASRELRGRFPVARTFLHDGVHAVPQNRHFVDALVDFLGLEKAPDARGEGANTHRTKLKGKGSLQGFSRALTKLLRHQVVKRGLRDKMTPDGFVPLDVVLSLPEFQRFSVADVTEVVRTNDKQRLGLMYGGEVIRICDAGSAVPPDAKPSEVKIRANQGHSISGLSDAELLTPVTLAEAEAEGLRVVHGTYKETWPLIERSGGLSRMARKHVHFAKTLDAVSGMRKSADLCVWVDVAKGIKGGLEWFISTNGVVLTPGDERGFVSLEFVTEVVERK